MLQLVGDLGERGRRSGRLVVLAGADADGCENVR